MKKQFLILAGAITCLLAACSTANFAYYDDIYSSSGEKSAQTVKSSTAQTANNNATVEADSIIYETDENGNVYVTFAVTEFSTFVLNLPATETPPEPEKEYTVIFKDYDGTVISSTTYKEGETVVVPANPVREDDARYIYTFNGWDKTVSTTCTGDATYTATYNQTEKEVPVPQTDGGSGCGGSITAGGSTGNVLAVLCALVVTSFIVLLRKKEKARNK